MIERNGFYFYWSLLFKSLFFASQSEVVSRDVSVTMTKWLCQGAYEVSCLIRK